MFRFTSACEWLLRLVRRALRQPSPDQDVDRRVDEGPLILTRLARWFTARSPVAGRASSWRPGTRVDRSGSICHIAGVDNDRVVRARCAWTLGEKHRGSSKSRLRQPKPSLHASGLEMSCWISLRRPPFACSGLVPGPARGVSRKTEAHRLAGDVLRHLTTFRGCRSGDNEIRPARLCRAGQTRKVKDAGSSPAAARVPFVAVVAQCVAQLVERHRASWDDGSRSDQVWSGPTACRKEGARRRTDSVVGSAPIHQHEPPRGPASVGPEGSTSFRAWERPSDRGLPGRGPPTRARIRLAPQ